MLIGENTLKKNRDKYNASLKKEILLKAQGFMERHELPHDPVLMHKEGFINYFLRLYAETYTNFPSHMTAQERITMVNIDLEPLKELDQKYKRLVTPFDPVTMEVPEAQKYDVILEGDKALEHELKIQALETLEKLQKIYKANIPNIQLMIKELQKRTKLNYYIGY